MTSRASLAGLVITAVSQALDAVSEQHQRLQELRLVLVYGPVEGGAPARDHVGEFRELAALRRWLRDLDRPIVVDLASLRALPKDRLGRLALRLTLAGGPGERGRAGAEAGGG